MNTYIFVKEIINEWDPIELLPHAPDDEYEPEIRDILKLLPSAKSVDELAVMIHQVFVKWFGADTIDAEKYSIKNCYPVALKIWAKLI